MKPKLILSVLVLASAACGAEPQSPAVADAPSFASRADSTSGDFADFDCQVVLRDVRKLEDRVISSDRWGHAEIEESANCTSDGRCWEVFEGTFDVVEDLALRGDAAMLYRSREGEFHTAAATAVAGGVAGYQRFAFRLDENTIVDGVPSMTLARAHIELVPYVAIGDQTRIFDHNVNADLTANYLLNQRGGWGYAQPGDVCPAGGAVLRFFDDFTHAQEGAIQAGGTLTVDYDLSRLPQCEGTWHNGHLAWQTSVALRFLPDETIVRRQLFVADGADVIPTPASVFVPAGAEAIELWFLTGGAGCPTHYDSNLDANYRFDVSR